MRNLVPLVVAQLQTAAEVPLPLQKVAVDEEFVFCCFVSQDTETIALHTWSPQTQWNASVQWSLPAPEARVVGLKGDHLDELATVIMSNGDVISVSLAESSATIVGSLEAEIEAAEWSPDGEVLCLALATGRVIFLSSSFEGLKDHSMTAADLELAEKHVTVGWGKRETQFQGRGARRDPTLLDRIETRETSAADDASTRLSWRGDGEFVVVNAIDPDSKKRALRVFSRAGELNSVSEPVDNILGMAAWQPVGALIACVKHSDAEGSIQFFERNGLRRHSFQIPDSQKVTALAWSADSAVLSVAYPTQVDLWTTKNYHWYRKQSLSVPHVANDPASVPMWHPEKPGTLIVPSASDIRFFTYRHAYSSDEGLVAVIDTNIVSVTPLAYVNMPPPMAFATIELAQQPLAVAVRAPGTIAVATREAVKVYELDCEEEKAHEVHSYELLNARFLAFCADELLAYTSDNTLVRFTSEGGEGGVQIADAPPSASAVTVFKGEHYLCNSQVYATRSGALVADFGEPCLDFIVKGKNSFALTRTGKLLHANTSAVLSHDVTSMLATTDHLLFTTLTKLKFVHLSATDTTLPVLPSDDNAASEQSREIERGSLLVSVIPSAMATVLQAPRGNIETIYPRMLVLGLVRRSVLSGEYAKAYQTCKVHRIDMNILYDLNPGQFLSQIPKILSQLNGDAQVDLFLSSLSDEDVTATKYVDSTADVSSCVGSTSGKTNRVIDAMLPHLTPQCTITALALKQPPQLAEALVSAAKDDKLVKHLCFLSDPEQLYKTALGVYDPALALVVAQQAQMDPKEYLPFLRARQSEPVHRRRFNIDLYLRQYKQALRNLVADETEGNDEEIVEFVNRHDLHSDALELLRSSSRPAKAQIMESQGQKWFTSAKYVEAGRNFELLGQTERATEAYVLGGDWRKALSLCPGEDARHHTASTLSEQLEASKRYADAAHLFNYYLHDALRAIECYCLACQFDDAILTARSHGFNERLSEALRESYATFQELLADCARQVPAQLRRLRELRAKRDEDALGFEQQVAELDVADNLSVAGTETTNASIFTRYTDKSSIGTAATNATRRTVKNQRRQERKRAMGKKGSVYEEEYLISSTTRLVERLQHVHGDIQGLVVALQRCELAVYAGQLVSEYDKVLRLLGESADEIYTVDERALVRFDESGHEYAAAAPIKPALPESLNL